MVWTTSPSETQTPDIDFDNLECLPVSCTALAGTAATTFHAIFISSSKVVLVRRMYGAAYRKSYRLYAIHISITRQTHEITSDMLPC